MNSLNKIRLQDICLTAHALERAKQRLDFGVDKNSIVFEAKLKELIQKGNYNHEEKGAYKYISVYQGMLVEIVVKYISPSKVSVLTIIVK